METLKSLPIETLQTVYFPHFTKMLESTNSCFIKTVTEFLYTNFVSITPPKIPDDSPLGQRIIKMHILSHHSSEKNPFTLYTRINSERKISFTSLLPYQTLEGKTVSLNLDEISKTADKALIQWSYGDLEIALGRKAISTEEIRALFQTLRNRNGTQINQFLRDSGLRSLEELEATLCSDVESSKWHRTGLPDEKASETTVMFNACFSFFLSRLTPPDVGATIPLSDSEIALLGFINVFIYCPTGRVEQLRTMHTNLKAVLPQAFQEKSSKPDYLKDYLHQIYRSELTNFLRENPELFARLHPGASNVHESEYLINLLGRRLGLLNGDVIFDPNTGVIHSEIIDKSTEELFQFILDQFTPEVLISKIQARITQDLSEDSPIKHRLGSSFEEFLKGPEMGWYYNIAVELEDRDPSKELISKLFIQNILIHAGIIETRDESSDAEAKPYLSLGVDATGHLIVI
jgi:hypothetical protein